MILYPRPRTAPEAELPVTRAVDVRSSVENRVKNLPNFDKEWLIPGVQLSRKDTFSVAFPLKSDEYSLSRREFYRIERKLAANVQRNYATLRKTWQDESDSDNSSSIDPGCETERHFPATGIRGVIGELRRNVLTFIEGFLIICSYKFMLSFKLRSQLIEKADFDGVESDVGHTHLL
ncbi:hypothetical protein G5I_09422 [Acromyrmex echinatior]|uniref:Uncharacterized protein n=1 Tax=Acromyrmex echinatior TaxID=103372 RepID=F4WU66_ACREC|nr:hypothetical protein G5I_09422 [Acromyrmex echinatior]